MRLCERNLSTFYYCTYIGKTEIMDGSTGTGEYKDSYNTAVATVGMVGGVTGNAVNNPYGISEEYDRSIIIEDTSCPITTSSVLFLDKSPSYAADGTPEFDYYVTRVGKNLGYFYVLAKKA